MIFFHGDHLRGRGTSVRRRWVAGYHRYPPPTRAAKVSCNPKSTSSKVPMKALEQLRTGRTIGGSHIGDNELAFRPTPALRRHWSSRQGARTRSARPDLHCRWFPGCSPPQCQRLLEKTPPLIAPSADSKQLPRTCKHGSKLPSTIHRLDSK